ncbi:MAG: hypothetical protein M1826_005190 [Phylliscum demangeonii]|nr:MAG: hypothetical protein M1826_005190 [Phylliscum demangeonii]
MDTLQSQTADAFESFLALAPSATSPRVAAELVTVATSAPDTYVFAELLAQPNIQSLRGAGPQFAPFLTLLEIFAWGTWRDYHDTPNLPALNAQQAHKLRLLSLLSLCKAPENLAYAALKAALDLPSPSSTPSVPSTGRGASLALENLFIAANAAGLVKGRLSPATQRVQIAYLSPLRDLAPGATRSLLAGLAKWEARCVEVQRELDAQAATVRRRAAQRARRLDSDRRTLDRALHGAADKDKEREKGAGKRSAADGVGHPGRLDSWGVDEGMGMGMGVGVGVGRGGRGAAGYRNPDVTYLPPFFARGGGAKTARTARFGKRTGG